MLKFIGITKEKEIYLPNKEYLSVTDENGYIWLPYA